MDTHSHEMLDAKLGAMDCGELSLAAQLRGEDHSVTLFDQAYFSAAFLLDWQAAGTQRHWLMRARDNLRHEIVQQLARGDALIRMPVSPQARKAPASAQPLAGTPDRGERGWTAAPLHHILAVSPHASGAELARTLPPALGDRVPRGSGRSNRPLRGG